MPNAQGAPQTRMQSEHGLKQDLSQRPLEGTLADLELLHACFAKNNDRPRSKLSLSWLYHEHTVPDRTFVHVAETPSGDRLAAVYATLPSWVSVRGERRLGLQSLDTLTDADYRGRGLFISLARSAYARAAEAGATFVYGFPNGNSQSGFFKKLGWHRLDPVPFLIRPIRPRYIASKIQALRSVARFVPNPPLALPWVPLPPGRKLIQLHNFDERATALWQEFKSQGVEVAVERDANYLNWRIARKPENEYRTLALEKAGRLEALCSFAIKGKHGGRVAYILELLHQPGATVSAALLLTRAVAACASAGADAVLSWCFGHSPNYSSFLWNGFVVLPERLRPIELHFGARALDDRFASVVHERSSWYLSYLDSDTV
jgi:hypothetical protein